MNPDRDTSALKGVAKPRSAGTIKRLQMYKNFKAKRTKNGAVIKAAPYQGYVDSGTRARVQPARGWFSNTKVITQSALQKFQVRRKSALICQRSQNEDHSECEVLRHAAGLKALTTQEKSD